MPHLLTDCTVACLFDDGNQASGGGGDIWKGAWELEKGLIEGHGAKGVT